MKGTTRRLGAVLGLLAFGWLASCGDDEESTACTPGTTRLCAGIGGCEGAHACLPDGSGYSDCDCTGALRQSNVGEPPIDETLRPTVSRPCESNEDCGDGLNCFTADSDDFFGGGPAGGYCSVACQADDDCAAVDPDAQCIPSLDGESGLCVRTCLSKSPESLVENKCLGRSDVVCRSVAELGIEEFSAVRQEGWCFPQCGSDEDCPGRVCNLASGLCVDDRPTGGEIGAACEADSDCQGNVCVGVGDQLFTDGGVFLGFTDAFCSAPCVFGQPVGCGFGPTAESRDSVCGIPRIRGFFTDEGIGDVGLCLDVCDVDEDCVQAQENGWFCSAEPATIAALGRGVCSAPDRSDPGPDRDAGDAAGSTAAPDSSDAAVNVDASN